MHGVDVLGYTAATCTTVAFIPQAWRVFRTGKTHDLSLAMFAIFTVGISLWLVYGLALQRGPIVFSNALTMILAGYILFMKLRE
ncbi:MAG: SemiSWEET transporter [Pseudomonadales bacterium]|nr:SemiSWEET transporter [Pseudomonadales bacterium]